MYEVELTIKNLNPNEESEFNNAAQEFVEELQGITDLEVDAKEKRVDNTRGFITLLTGIVVKAIELGVIAGIYTLAKDLYDNYHNAEVELNFKNGNSITLKNLTYEEAVKLIEEHSKSDK